MIARTVIAQGRYSSPEDVPGEGGIFCFYKNNDQKMEV